MTEGTREEKHQNHQNYYQLNHLSQYVQIENCFSIDSIHLKIKLQLIKDKEFLGFIKIKKKPKEKPKEKI